MRNGVGTLVVATLKAAGLNRLDAKAGRTDCFLPLSPAATGEFAHPATKEGPISFPSPGCTAEAGKAISDICDWIN